MHDKNKKELKEPNKKNQKNLTKRTKMHITTTTQISVLRSSARPLPDGELKNLPLREGCSRFFFNPHVKKICRSGKKVAQRTMYVVSSRKVFIRGKIS